MHRFHTSQPTNHNPLSPQTSKNAEYLTPFLLHFPKYPLSKDSCIWYIITPFSFLGTMSCRHSPVLSVLENSQYCTQQQFLNTPSTANNAGLLDWSLKLQVQ